MKSIIKFSFVVSIMFAFTSCSDDDKKANEQNCECYYTLVEGGEEQQGWTQSSDSTDCDLDGVKVYYEDWNNGEPNDTYYRVLHCSPN